MRLWLSGTPSRLIASSPRCGASCASRRASSSKPLLVTEVAKPSDRAQASRRDSGFQVSGSPPDMPIAL